VISMIPKLCPQFVADIVRRAANDHDPVQFKLPQRVLAQLRGQRSGSAPLSSTTMRPAAAPASQHWAMLSANENPLATVREAEQMLRCCKTTVNTLINAGKLERVKVGRATRITVRSIRAITGGL
jgi:excisionase family DNA binding protein